MQESLAVSTFPETKQLPWRNVCCRCGKIETGTIEILADAKLNPLVTDSLCTECGASQQARWMADIAQRKADARAEKLQKMHCIPDDLLFWDSVLGNRDLANNIQRNKNKSLLICGGYGTGKTRAAAANLSRLAEGGENVRFYRWADLSREYADVCRSESEKSSEFIKRLCKFSVLLVDDVGKRRLTETAGELLFDLVDKIYLGEVHCRLWITTNLTLLRMARNFSNPDVGNAFASRIDRLIEEGKMTKLEAGEK